MSAQRDFIDGPVGGDLAVTALSLTNRLALSTITDLSSLAQAVEDRQQIGDAMKRVKEFFAPLKDGAHKLHRQLCDRENEIVAPLVRLDGEKSAAMTAFKKEQDRIRHEREREIVEQRRRDDELRAMTEAAHLESAGEHAMAAAVIEEQIAARPAVIALPDDTKAVEGLKFRTDWKWRYAGDDAARAMTLIPRAFLCPDEKKIGAYAKGMKSTGSIPGIEIFSVDTPIR